MKKNRLLSIIITLALIGLAALLICERIINSVKSYNKKKHETGFEYLDEEDDFDKVQEEDNDEEDNDTVYPEYHTHDTFKVHNKLAEVISVLVDKDDDVYGYEVKFVDSDDTFIVYPEEIED